MKELEWNVYIQRMGNDQIRAFNVFDHRGFLNDMKKLLKKDLDRASFSEELKRAAMYYFWSKCEYELIITSWPAHIKPAELSRLNSEAKTCARYSVDLDITVKVDVYQQLQLNWERFIDYVLSSK